METSAKSGFHVEAVSHTFCTARFTSIGAENGNLLLGIQWNNMDTIGTEESVLIRRGVLISEVELYVRTAFVERKGVLISGYPWLHCITGRVYRK